MLRKGSGELPLPLPPLGMIHAVISVLSGIKTMSGENFGHNLISEAPSASKLHVKFPVFFIKPRNVL